MKTNFCLKKDCIAIVYMLSFCFPAMLSSIFLVFFTFFSGSIFFGTDVILGSNLVRKIGWRFYSCLGTAKTRPPLCGKKG